LLGYPNKSPMMDLGRVAKSFAVSGGLVIIVLLALIAGTGVQTTNSEKLTVAATFFPIYDWTLNIVGDKATVVNLTPPGMDPHELDPTPQDLSLIMSSRLFIYNGAGIQPWVEKILQTIDRSRTLAVDISLGVDIMHSELGQPDPHIWLDPISVITAIENIELGMSHVDPMNSAYYRQNTQEYLARLRAVHEAFAANLTSVRIRTFITFHEAFGYWKRDYNITEVGIYGFDPEGEPSAAHIQELVDLAKTYRITTILASNLDDPHWCKVLADQIGGRVSILDPLEGPTEKQAQTGDYTYISRLYHNIAVLKEALD
jgi:zinc transport system substrate-binding protein